MPLLIMRLTQTPERLFFIAAITGADITQSPSQLGIRTISRDDGCSGVIV
jgi:hypothetical protein